MAHFQIERLRRLPQDVRAEWEGGVVRLPLWDDAVEGAPRRFWSAIWINQARQTLHLSKPDSSHKSDYEMALDALVEMAVKPNLAGNRPGRLAVNDKGLADYLTPLLKEIGVAVRYDPQLKQIEASMQNAAAMRPGTEAPGMMTVKGQTVARVKGFAEASIEFSRAEPWMHLNEGDAIYVESPASPNGFSWAVVLGAGSLLAGLAMFETYEQCRAFAEREVSGVPVEHPVWLLRFESIMNLPIADADLWEDNDLPMVAQAACPWLFCKTVQGAFKRPGAKQLTFVEGLLRAIARSSVAEIETGYWSKSVQTVDGPVEYQLSLPDLLRPVMMPETLFQKEVWNIPGAIASINEHADRLGFLQPGLNAHERLRQAVEEVVFLRGSLLAEDFGSDRPLTASERADHLVGLAGDQPSRRVAIRLARQALLLDRDCIEGYVQMALHEPDPEQLLEFYRQGTEAGRRRLTESQVRSPENSEQNILRETYLFAWCGVVGALAHLDRFDEAIEEGFAIRQMDPNDDAVVRFMLIMCLLVANRNDEARRLWAEFPDEEQIVWPYARALLTFRQEGASALATDYLCDAMELDGTLAEMILGPDAYESEPDADPVSEEGVSCTAEDLEDPDEEPMMHELANLQNALDDFSSDSDGGPTAADNLLDDMDYIDELDDGMDALLGRAWRETPEALVWLQQTLDMYRRSIEPEDED